MSLDAGICNADDILTLPGLTGLLGHGTFGEVRIGYHSSYGSLALKCVRLFNDGNSEKDRSRIEHEARIVALASSRCSNIVRSYGLVKWNSSNLAILMEYLPGGNLFDFITNQKLERIPATMQLTAAFDISQGLKHIHGLFDNGKIGIVHGDLKPENILLTEDFRCKIGDFGTAAHIDEESVPMKQHETFRREFTRVYTAPERLRECSMKPTRECDVYSFGMLVYFILTRRHPVAKNQTEEEFTEFVKKGQRPELDVLDDFVVVKSDSDVVSTLVDVMESCWKQSSSDRPSIKDVADDLCRHFMQTKRGAKTAQAVSTVMQNCDVKWISPLLDPKGWVQLPKLGEGDFEEQEDEGSSSRIIQFEEDHSELSSESWEMISSKSSYSTQAQLTDFAEGNNFLILAGEKTPFSACLLDTSSKTWKNLPDLPLGKKAGCAVRYRNLVLSFGGRTWDGANTNGFTNEVNVMDLSQTTLEWSKHHPTGEKRGYAAACLYEDDVIIAGGDGGDVLSFCEAYSPSTGISKKLRSLNQARYGHAIASCEGSIYTIGGWSGAKQLASMERLDPREGKWKYSTHLPVERNLLSAVSIGPDIYAIGGWYNRDACSLSKVEKYDTRNNQWVEMASMNESRYGFDSCVLNGKIYVFGGSAFVSGTTIRNSVECYDPISDSWEVFCNTNQLYWRHNIVKI